MPPTSTTRRSAPPTRGEREAAPRDGQPRERESRATMSVPVPVPRIRMPSGAAGNVIWWGGLAAVAALGVVDWPVAAIVAAGTWVAEQQSKQSAEQQLKQGQRPRAPAA